MSAFMSFVVYVALGASVTFLFALWMNKRIKWFVPPITVAQLSRDLSKYLGDVCALQLALTAKLEAFDEQLLKTTRTLETIEYAKEAITELLKSQALRQLESLPEDVYQDIVRDITGWLCRVLSQPLLQRLQNVGSEYVLLHNLDDFEMEVTLVAGYSDWQTLQRALKRVERFRPETDKTGNVTPFDADRQFGVYLNKLGEALFDLKWSGQLSLRRKQHEHARSTLARVPNTQ